MTKKISSTFCAYPWDAIAVRPDGLILPCCRYPHLDILKKESTIDKDARNSSHWYDIRRKMLNGEQVEGCSLCYKQENNNVKSMRQSSLSRGIHYSDKPSDIRYLEIAFSNLCNLACVSCSAEFSSKWKAEDIKHGRLEKDKALNSYEYVNLPLDLSKVETLKIIGGEPFLEQEKFIHLMKQLNLKQVSLNVYTNGTVLPNEEFRSLIEQCKFVRLNVSVDGLDTVNDWYRWPSKWNEIEQNLKSYNYIWKNSKKIALTIHHVINAYNVWTIKDFLDYFQEKFPLWMIEWAWIESPKWQTLSVIPKEFKEELINKFSIYVDMYNRQNWPFGLTINYLREKPKTSWETFKTMTIRFENERNLKVLEMIPSLKDAWEKY